MITRRFLLFCFLWSPLAALADGKCPPAPADAFRKPAKDAACYAVTFYSPSLGRNVDYNVVVPPGYSAAADEPLPYAIFLHGRGGNRDQLPDMNAVEALDANSKKGGKPFLMITPSGGDNYWMNGAVSKRKYGDMVTKDLVAHIEKTYRVSKGDPCRRALFGISMGGNGAVQLGLNNPDTFCTVASMSPVFRRQQDIWRPGTDSPEPKDDYGSYGTGKDFEARSARHLCEKRKDTSGRCLPFKNYRLEIGADDPNLDRYPDTRAFIEDLKKGHPDFEIGVRNCDDKNLCAKSKDCNAHTAPYWRCRMPGTVDWIARQFAKEDRRIAPPGSSGPASPGRQ